MSPDIDGLRARRSFRRELLAAQTENSQLEKKLYELQMSLQNPGMPNRLSDAGNGLSAAGSSAPPTPLVVRKYYEMKYGEKGPPVASSPTNATSNHSNSPSLDGSQTNSSPARNGVPPGKTPSLSTSVPQPSVTMGARASAFNLRNKLPTSIQTTLTNTSQSLQSKLPASLQNLPGNFAQGSTMNMLANRFQNAFS